MFDSSTPLCLVILRCAQNLRCGLECHVWFFRFFAALRMTKGRGRASDSQRHVVGNVPGGLLLSQEDVYHLCQLRVLDEERIVAPGRHNLTVFGVAAQSGEAFDRLALKVRGEEDVAADADYERARGWADPPKRG